MRTPLPEGLEAARITDRSHPWWSERSDGANGAFIIARDRGPRLWLRIIASDARGSAEAGLEPWEHVSVSTETRCPTWEDMCRVKDLFWREDECVMQLHPPKSDWINNHSHCLHLWKPVGLEIPRPPGIMVGIQKLGELA